MGFCALRKVSFVIALVALAPTSADAVIWYYSSGAKAKFKRLTGDRNVHFSELGLADLNGDGKADVFHATGQSWRVSYGGSNKWKTLRTTTVTDVRFGDMNGDGKQDVFWQGGSNWYFSSGGRGNAQKLARSTIPAANVRLADFTGDGRADVFFVSRGRWMLSVGGRKTVKRINGSGIAQAQLRIGDFNGDKKADVFTIVGNQWRVSYGGTSGWQRINSLRVPIGNVVVADITGDGKSDVVRVGARYFYVSVSGKTRWRKYGSNPRSFPASRLLFADMNNDKRVDVLADRPVPEPCRVQPLPVARVKRRVTGQWDFKCGDFQATVGKALVPVNMGSAAKFESKVLNFTRPDGRRQRGTFSYMKLSKLAKSRTLRMYHGVRTRNVVNEYTLIVDVLLVPGKTRARSFLQTNTSNNNDYELGVDRYHRPYKPVVSGHSRKRVRALRKGTWHRVTASVWLRKGKVAIHYYVDGKYVKYPPTMQSFKKGQRYSLDRNFALLFSDESGEAGDIYVSSVQFRNYAMVASEVRPLGHAHPAGIPVTPAYYRSINNVTGMSADAPPPKTCSRWERTVLGHRNVRCGCNGHRACRVWEAIPSCKSGLHERRGKCKSSNGKSPVLATFEGAWKDTKTAVADAYQKLDRNSCQTLLNAVPELANIKVSPVKLRRGTGKYAIDIPLDARGFARCAQGLMEGAICKLPSLIGATAEAARFASSPLKPPKHDPRLCGKSPAALRTLCNYAAHGAWSFGADTVLLVNYIKKMFAASRTQSGATVQWGALNRAGCHALGGKLASTLLLKKLVDREKSAVRSAKMTKAFIRWTDKREAKIGRRLLRRDKIKLWTTRIVRAFISVGFLKLGTDKARERMIDELAKDKDLVK